MTTTTNTVAPIPATPAETQPLTTEINAPTEAKAKLYLNADFGGAFRENAQLRQSQGIVPQYSTTFNPGIRADIDLGYNLNDSWAVELETGFIWNSVDEIGGTPLGSYSQSIDLYSIPVLANIIYKVPTKTSWTPYFGVGAGGVVGIFDFKTSGTDFSDTDFAFAWQAEAGLKYALTKNASFGIAYKFLGTLNQRYYLGGGYPGGTMNDHVKLDGVYINAVEASFTWTF
jgi:opacity protein-like surface antigen